MQLLRLEFVYIYYWLYDWLVLQIYINFCGLMIFYIIFIFGIDY